MCIGIPMLVTEVGEFSVRCTAKGVEREVSLFMLQGETIEVGDYIKIQLGYAIEKMTEQDARASWELFDQVLNAGTATGESGPPDRRFDDHPSRGDA